MTTRAPVLARKSSSVIDLQTQLASKMQLSFARMRGKAFNPSHIRSHSLLINRSTRRSLRLPFRRNCDRESGEKKKKKRRRSR